MEKKTEKPTVFSDKAPKPIDFKEVSERIRKESKEKKKVVASAPSTESK